LILTDKGDYTQRSNFFSQIRQPNIGTVAINQFLLSVLAEHFYSEGSEPLASTLATIT
jgi:hypothetical protein